MNNNQVRVGNVDFTVDMDVCSNLAGMFYLLIKLKVAFKWKV